MTYIFGYSREVRVKIERNPSKLALVGLAVLIVVLFIFLSFEDLNDRIGASDLVFNPAAGSAQTVDIGVALEMDSEIVAEQDLWRSELNN